MFRDFFFGFDPNGDKLKALVASWIYRDREMDEGGYFDRSTLKGLCDMLVELADGRKTYYENIIEKPFFEASHAFIQVGISIHRTVGDFWSMFAFLILGNSRRNLHQLQRDDVRCRS